MKFLVLRESLSCEKEHKTNMLYESNKDILKKKGGGWEGISVLLISTIEHSEPITTIISLFWCPVQCTIVP